MSSQKDWIDVIAVDALEKGWVTPVALGPRALAVYDAEDGIYVSLALCNHGGADLTEGYFDGHVIECPWHQGAFDIRTGQPVCAPATRRMRVFETRVVDGMVQIKA